MLEPWNSEYTFLDALWNWEASRRLPNVNTRWTVCYTRRLPFIIRVYRVKERVQMKRKVASGNARRAFSPNSLTVSEIFFAIMMCLWKVCRAVVLSWLTSSASETLRGESRISWWRLKSSRIRLLGGLFLFPSFLFAVQLFCLLLGYFWFYFFGCFTLSLNSAISRALLSLKSAKTERTRLRDLSTLTKFQT